MTKYILKRFNRKSTPILFTSYDEARAFARRAIRKMYPATGEVVKDRQVDKVGTVRWYGYHPNVTDFGFSIKRIQ